MRFEYLDRVDFARALERQEELHAAATQNSAYDTVLGFEPRHAVITMGKREVSVRSPGEPYVNDGGRSERFEVFQLDRGGQSTIHNPGQLVIFPVCTVESGVRAWVERLWQTTLTVVNEYGCQAAWDEACPGLYTARGKIVSMGVRVRRGVSTHGIAINVSNRLEDFQAIHACGVRNAKMDRMGTDIRLSDVFVRWCEIFEGRKLTSRPEIANLVEPSVRS